jgi:hypothetical protein
MQDHHLVPATGQNKTVGPFPITMTPGQSVTLSLAPAIAGHAGGTFPGPITWSNNSANGHQLVSMTPTGTSCVVGIQSGSPGGSFTVTAQCGSLNSNVVIMVVAPASADSMIMSAGAPHS